MRVAGKDALKISIPMKPLIHPSVTLSIFLSCYPFAPEWITGGDIGSCIGQTQVPILAVDLQIVSGALPVSTEAAFSPVATAKTLLRTARTAALATLDTGTGGPFASLVTVATAPEGSPVMLLSTLAAHTRNLLQDPRASILIDDRSTFSGNDALAGVRLTLTGRLVKVADSDGVDAEAIARRRFLARHPEAEGYATFRDFAMYRLDCSNAHLVAGFGRINDIAAAELLTDCSRAAALIEAEPEIVEHMNNDHSDTTRAYAMHLLAQPDGAWSVVGCDPDGLDLAAEMGGKWRDARLNFPRSVTAAGPLRAILKELAEQLRNSEVVKSI